MPVPLRNLAGAALVVGAAAAYANSLPVPFVFDDLGAVVRNTSLHSLGTALTPPAGGFTVTGRPLLNLSFALNYAVGGLHPVGYHLANAVIHVLATLVLFGLVRRALDRHLGAAQAPRALGVAFAAALLWSLHPLQTESVTYISQRAESLMGLCFLLTLYCFERAGSAGRSRWRALSVLCCLAGMATKEVAASLPVIVLLYDRTFVSGGFAAAWRQRRGYYLALGATWLLLACEIIGAKSRGGTTGFGLGVPWADYVFSQGSALTHYLRLALWPSPLVFDYGIAPPFHPLVVAGLAAVLILTLAVTTLWALRQHPAAGFLGVWFFAILVPTSLVPGNRQTWAEHRMYLALVPLAVLLSLWLMRARAWTWPLVAAIALGFGLTTFARNRDYRSNLVLWADTVAKRPDNPFARYNLGVEFLAAGQYPEAETALRAAVALKGNYAEAHNNLANALLRTGQTNSAQAEFETAARLKPGDAEIRNNLGNAYLSAGRLDQAATEYRAAIAADAGFATPHSGLGKALLRRREFAAAAAEFATVIRLDPGDGSTRTQLGTLLLALGRPDEANLQFAEAVRLDPDNGSVRFNYANALAQQHRFGEAIGQYQAALAASPADPLIHYNFGTALFLAGRKAEARIQYLEALRLQPKLEKARERLRQLDAPTSLQPPRF